MVKRKPHADKQPMTSVHNRVFTTNELPVWNKEFQHYVLKTQENHRIKWIWDHLSTSSTKFYHWQISSKLGKVRGNENASLSLKRKRVIRHWTSTQNQQKSSQQLTNHYLQTNNKSIIMTNQPTLEWPPVSYDCRYYIAQVCRNASPTASFFKLILFARIGNNINIMAKFVLWSIS